MNPAGGDSRRRTRLLEAEPQDVISSDRFVGAVDAAIDRPARADVKGLIAETIALSKLGIVKMVLVTAAVGLALSALERGVNTWTLGEFAGLFVLTMLGTGLSACGANALNQCWEIARDARMERTRERPLASGRLSARAGLVIGMVLSCAGVMVLWAGATAAAGLVSLLTIVSYVLIYTPLKPVTPWATWVGAVPGALPPLIGWAAASDDAWGGLGHSGGWTVFLIMFAWQIPHFLALAWKYREDYARGGFAVLPVVDPSGDRTMWTSFSWTLVMIGASLTPIWALAPRVGPLYGATAILLGLWLLRLAVRLMHDRSEKNARGLFIGSLVYLPIILLALVGDAAWPPLR